MFQEYIDFEIQISPLSESRYAVSVSGPGGDASGALVLPTNDPTYLELANRLQQLDTDESALAELGQILFQSLFQGAIRDVYARSQGMLGPDQGLRLRLNIAASEVAAIALPWEFLHDPDQGPLALLDAPVMRYLPQSARIPTLQTDLPLKVLVTGAHTPPPTDVERELADVVAALSDLGEHVAITIEEHLTVGKLQKRLRDGFHIWHFVGHGGYARDGKTGVLHFEDAAGDVETVSAMQLGILLNRSGVRLVMLNACQTGRLATDVFRSMAPALVRAQIPAVVAMQFSVPQEATRAFAGEFYRALAEGFPIDACVTEGRKATMNATGLSNADWGIPVIYTRAHDGRLFELPTSPAQAPAPTTAPAQAPSPPAPPPTEPIPAAKGPPPENRANNLPAMPTALVGRHQDIAAARTLIERPEVRLLTLTGTGGTGKTRLAIQIAAEMTGQFAHGVWFVNLAPIGNSALVAATIAHTLAIKESGDQSPLAALKDYLRERELLLVLDNFEQVLDAAPLIAELLAGAPRLQVLVTSRAALRISGEFEFPVAPLALPNLRHLPPLAELAQNPSVALFAERAHAVKAAFALNESNARAVAEICARLDGLPLAIELAAARINVLTPQVLLQRLANRLDILTGGARDLAARQQTLRGAIAWSYDLLNENERALFAALAVFAGGAALEAIEAVCAGWEPGAGSWGNEVAAPTPGSQLPTSILDGLGSLVDKSLLRQVEDADGEARFLMLETIREFATERLAASGEAAELRRRHAEYFLALAERAEPELSGAGQAAWLDRLEREHDNLRAALQCSLDQGDNTTALRLSGALGRFWFIRGYLSEGRGWLDRALTAPLAPPGGDERTAKEIRAKALNAAGVLAWVQADYPQARTHYEECLGLRKELGDFNRTAQALNNLGMINNTLGDYAGAVDLYNAALTLYRKHGNQLGAARALNNLGTIAERQGDRQQARTFYQESLALFRELNNDHDIAILLGNLGELELQQANYAQAIEYYTEGLKLHQHMGDRGYLALCLDGIANVATQQGRLESAARLWSAAESLRVMTNTRLEPSQGSSRDRTLSAARAKLDPVSWNAAWEAGRTMTLDQALAEAATVSASPAANEARAERTTTPIAASSVQPASPRIVVATAAGPQTIVLDPLPLTIGRGADCDAVLDDARVSRRHAQVSYRPPDIILADLGSTNGTEVNGERIAERALRDGDMISFGGLEATYHAAAGAQNAPKDT